MTDGQPVRVADRLSASEIDEVLALAAAAERADGVYPLSEDVVLRVRGGGARPAAYICWPRPTTAWPVMPSSTGRTRRGRPASWWSIRVAPAWARHARCSRRPATARCGSGRTATSPARRPSRRRTASSAVARPLADAPPPDVPLPDAPLPAGVTVRGFRPGSDEQAWLGVNARAFAHHPEQGRWTLDDLRLREHEPWFDPAGFLLAVDIEDTVLGFHWTKVHPPAGDDPALGEMYVLGVDPGGHRRGLGAALTVEGLRHLAAEGLTTAMLYVDESNAAAVALYRRFGFEIYQADVSYQRSLGADHQVAVCGAPASLRARLRAVYGTTVTGQRPQRTRRTASDPAIRWPTLGRRADDHRLGPGLLRHLGQHASAGRRAARPAGRRRPRSPPGAPARCAAGISSSSWVWSTALVARPLWSASVSRVAGDVRA